ncbi:hypothetical protein A2U01_0072583 [Trifolium medium]|uniref:Uncharacterized protein n=1 Tax=Trifolium medium TaxID=97028 RepID=A0A392SRM0_9FABA|nr:hypothetical protein [Trifolium medium]
MNINKEFNKRYVKGQLKGRKKFSYLKEEALDFYGTKKLEMRRNDEGMKFGDGLGQEREKHGQEKKEV